MPNVVGICVSSTYLTITSEVYLLAPRDSDIFPMVILFQNHREIYIAESISASIKVVIACTKGVS